MDPLIESLKQQDQIEAAAQETANRIRLHDADIIQAKAGDFWDRVTSYLRVLCSDLVATFPNNSKRHAFLDPSLPNGFFINGGGLPRRILAAQLDTKGQRVTLSLRVKQSFDDHPDPQYVAPIAITVGKEEELIYSFMGKREDDPHNLARALLRYVCGL